MTNELGSLADSRPPKENEAAATATAASGCGPQAQEVDRLEKRRDALAAQSLTVTGKDAWPVLCELADVTKKLPEARRALADCIAKAATGTTGTQDGPLVVQGDVQSLAACGNAQQGPQEVALWDLTNVASQVEPAAAVSPQNGAFELQHQLATAAAITVRTTSHPEINGLDFRSGLIVGPATGALHIEIVMGPNITITYEALNEAIASLMPVTPPSLSGPGVEVVATVTGLSVEPSSGSLSIAATGTVSGTVLGLSLRGTAFSGRVGMGLSPSLAPDARDVVDVTVTKPADVQFSGSAVAAVGNAFFPLFEPWLESVALANVRDRLAAVVPTVTAEALAIAGLPSRSTLSLRSIDVGIDGISFWPAVGCVGNTLSTYSPAAPPPSSPDPAEATRLQTQAWQQWNAGNHSDGLATMRQAVEAFEDLAAADPGQYLPRLGSCLIDEAKMRDADTAAALGAGLRAVGIFEQLTGLSNVVQYPAAYPDLPPLAPNPHWVDLAQALYVLAYAQWSAGQQPQAMLALRDRVRVYELLDKQDPAQYRAALGRSLIDQAEFRAADPAGGQDAARRAVGIFEDLTGVSSVVRYPAPYPTLPPLPLGADWDGLSLAIYFLGYALWDMRQQPDGTRAMEDRVQVYDMLARQKPDQYEVSLGKALIDVVAFRAGDPPGAQVAGRRAVAIFEKLAGVSALAHYPAPYPDLSDSASNEYWPNLGQALNFLAHAEWEIGQRPEAATTAADCLQVYQALDHQHPGQYDTELKSARDLVAAFHV